MPHFPNNEDQKTASKGEKKIFWDHCVHLMTFNKCDTQQRSFELKTKRAVVLLFEAILISKQQCLMGPHFMFCSGLMYLLIYPVYNSHWLSLSKEIQSLLNWNRKKSKKRNDAECIKKRWKSDEINQEISQKCVNVENYLFSWNEASLNVRDNYVTW